MDENCYEERKPLIFAVDDDEINLLLISRILGEFTEVRTAQSGTEALNYLAENSVDLVLMDYNMPDRDGLETLKYMKHSRAEMKNVPVIILTGDTDLDLETEVFRSGAVDFIRKPFVPMAMQERVRRVLQNEYLKRNLRREVDRQTKLAREQAAATARLFDETVLALAETVDAKDPYTKGHSLRVAEYSRHIATLAGKTSRQQYDVYCMGLLHDVGKIGIPDEIINKPARLTDEEYGIIKSHTAIGAGILKKIVDFPQLVLGARSHHERYDGKGYPQGLKGTDIPTEARIIAVADAYDAMTSCRSYRGIMEQSRVRYEIERGIGKQFDPVFAAIMLQLIDEDKDFQMRGQLTENEA